MPSISFWMVRCSLAHFAIAATIGAGILMRPVWPMDILLDRILHVEPMLIGFMLQFALGIALWILPRTRPRTPLPHPTTVVLLNVGVCLVALSGWISSLLLPGRLCEAVAVIVVVRAVLPRIRVIIPHRN